MAKTKRMGPQDSAVSNALLDATERILRKEGYAAATSRRVAQEAGVKQQLVYYYFHSMDELFVASFKRRTKRGIERLKERLDSERPLHALWSERMNAADSKIIFEYMALANRNSGIRKEIKRFVELSRQMEADALSKAFKNHAMGTVPVSPAALSFLVSATVILLRREADNGITSAHDDVLRVVQWLLGRLE
jgi:AcrR family transcriptional regulator